MITLSAHSPAPPSGLCARASLPDTKPAFFQKKINFLSQVNDFTGMTTQFHWEIVVNIRTPWRLECVASPLRPTIWCSAFRQTPRFGPSSRRLLNRARTFLPACFEVALSASVRLTARLDHRTLGHARGPVATVPFIARAGVSP